MSLERLATMSTNSDFALLFGFTWTVEKPLPDKPKRSPSFRMYGMNLYLEYDTSMAVPFSHFRLRFSLRPGIRAVQRPACKCYSLHLRTTENEIVPLDFLNELKASVDVKVKNKIPELLSWTCSLSEVPVTIWSMGETGILNHIPSFDEDGIVTFMMTFTIPALENEKDESIQTSPCIYNLHCLEKLSEDFSKLLAGGSSQPDVMLICGDQTAHVHSQILKSRSDVLAATLSNDMAESRTGRIEIRDMDPEIFKIFLRYLYTGVLPEFTTETAKCLYEAGDRHAVHGLVKRCSRYLEENLSEENVCEILVLADAHSDQAFKEVALNYILEKEIHLNHKDWDDFYKRHESLGNEVHFRFCKKVRKF